MYASLLPILVLTRGGVESSSARLAARHLDNVMLLERPIQALTLVSAVRMAVKARHRQYQVRDYLAEQQRQQKALRATFEQAAVGIERVARDGRLLDVNPALCQMLGYSREELLQRTFADITHPEDLVEEQKYLDQLLAGQASSYTMEKRYLRKDGQSVWVPGKTRGRADSGGRAPDRPVTGADDGTHACRAP